MKPRHVLPELATASLNLSSPSLPLNIAYEEEEEDETFLFYTFRSNQAILSQRIDHEP